MHSRPTLFACVVKGNAVNRLSTTFISEMSPGRSRAWSAFGLWLRVLIAALAVMAMGVTIWVGGSESSASASGFLVGGGALALLAWRRIHVALGHADRPAKVAKSAANTTLLRPIPLPSAMRPSSFGMPAK